MTAPASETDDEIDTAIDSAIERMKIRGRLFALLVLWDYLAGPDPRPLSNDPASDLVRDSEAERDILDAGPSMFIDAATICATDRFETFCAAFNESQRLIIAKATAALRVMDLEPPAAFADWKPHTQASLMTELTMLAGFAATHH
jgi:hypothetical protein